MDSYKKKQIISFGSSMNWDIDIMVPKREGIAETMEERIKFHQASIEWHQNQIIEVTKLMDYYTKEVQSKAPVMDEMITNYGIVNAVEEEIPSQKTYWKKMAQTLILKRNKLMRSKEIIDGTDEMLSAVERKNAMVNLSAGLSELCEEGVLKRYAAQGVKGYYYGLPYMFDGESPSEKYRNKNTI